MTYPDGPFRSRGRGKCVRALHGSEAVIESRTRVAAGGGLLVPCLIDLEVRYHLSTLKLPWPTFFERTIIAAMQRLPRTTQAVRVLSWAVNVEARPRPAALQDLNDYYRKSRRWRPGLVSRWVVLGVRHGVLGKVCRHPGLRSSTIMDIVSTGQRPICASRPVVEREKRNARKHVQPLREAQIDPVMNLSRQLLRASSRVIIPPHFALDERAHAESKSPLGPVARLRRLDDC